MMFLAEAKDEKLMSFEGLDATDDEAVGDTEEAVIG